MNYGRGDASCDARCARSLEIARPRETSISPERSERSPLHDVRYHAAAKSRISRSTAAKRINFLDEPKPAGGARRDRTDDLLLAKQALSQLSYGPSSESQKADQDQTVDAHEVACASTSTHRSFAAEVLRSDWWAWEDLNFRPHAYQACALTT